MRQNQRKDDAWDRVRRAFATDFLLFYRERPALTLTGWLTTASGKASAREES